jgi:hypothetical protein
MEKKLEITIKEIDPKGNAGDPNYDFGPRKPKREFKPRPEIKINKPFAALAGVKIGK